MIMNFIKKNKSNGISCPLIRLQPLKKQTK